MTLVSSWGLLKKTEHNIYPVADRLQRQFLQSEHLGDNRTFLPRGNGRSYGDVCINSGGTLLWTGFLDKFVDFDPQNMTVTVESGVLLRDLQRFLVVKGFMLPVTPGTQEVSVGGAIACDVHCKNHHMYGTFGCNVKSFKLLRTDGELLTCSSSENAGFFKATIGGLGLTGLVVEATLLLKKVAGSWINAENIPFANLNEFFDLSKASENKYEHTVSWIDCITGDGERGIFMRGNNSERRDCELLKGSINFPFTPPFSLVNSLSLRLFNTFYYYAQSLKSRPFWVQYEKFFYPLDHVGNWNRIYGKKGFYQYQCVVPMSAGYDAVSEIQQQIAKANEGSFLGVLKTFGRKKSPGLLSFPVHGVTYALDFPNRGDKTEKLFRNLDSIVRESGGRLYLAKDARQPKELFELGYGDAMNEFIKYADPRISSDLSRRLMGF
jgi:FAD/FMN-containing dehydrogenase